VFATDNGIFFEAFALDSGVAFGAFIFGYEVDTGIGLIVSLWEIFPEPNVGELVFVQGIVQKEEPHQSLELGSLIASRSSVGADFVE